MTMALGAFTRHVVHPALLYRVTLLALLVATAWAFLWMYRLDVIATTQNRDGAFILDRWTRGVSYCERHWIEGQPATRCADFYPATWDAVRRAADAPRMAAGELALWDAMLAAGDARWKIEHGDPDPRWREQLEKAEAEISRLIKSSGGVPQGK